MGFDFVTFSLACCWFIKGCEIFPGANQQQSKRCKKRIKSSRVQLETLVRKPLLKQPTAEVKQQFARYSWMSFIEMRIIQLLKRVSKNLVHHKRQIGRTTAFAKLIVFLKLVHRVTQSDDEVLQETLTHFADFVFEVQQKFTQDPINGSVVGLVQLRLILLLAPIPVLFYVAYIKLVLFAELFKFAVPFSLLLVKRKKLSQIFLQDIHIVGIFILFLLRKLILGVFLFVWGPCELDLAIVLSLDVSVECGVAEV